MKILCIGIMQTQDFINLKNNFTNLILYKSNETQLSQIKQNTIKVKRHIYTNDG